MIQKQSKLSVRAILAGCLLAGLLSVGQTTPAKPLSEESNRTQSPPPEASSDQSAPANNHSLSAPFRVFDATLFKDKPDLTAFGMERANIIYEASLFAENSPPESMPSYTAIERVARDAKTGKGTTILDVERWIWLLDAPERYVYLVQQFKGLSPLLKLGYYSVTPKRDYWRASEGVGSAKYREWQQENDKLQPVADCVDYLFPSIYTFYDNQQGWVAYAEANIGEARRLAKGKPVYAFLWFQYHESNRQLGNTPIPAGFWRLQLDTMKRLADGVVIWGGGKWDPKAPWWVETQKFLAELQMENPK